MTTPSKLILIEQEAILSDEYDFHARDVPSMHEVPRELDLASTKDLIAALAKRSEAFFIATLPPMSENTQEEIHGVALHACKRNDVYKQWRYALQRMMNDVHRDMVSRGLCDDGDYDVG